MKVGGSHTYRFVVDRAGTYWYHSHQVSHTQVQRGLFGAIVVAPCVRNLRSSSNSPSCMCTTGSRP